MSLFSALRSVKARPRWHRGITIAWVLALLFGMMAEFFGPGLSPAKAATGTITEYSIGVSTNITPHGITNGSDGNLWFTEADSNKIGRITPSGTITEYSSGLTTGSYPSGITSGPDGNLWFTEYVGNRIGRINPTTGTITEFSTGLTAGSNPSGITSGPDGNIWFAEQLGGRIGRIDPTTGTITEFSTGLTAGSNPSGITAGTDGNIWFTEITANKIGRINPITVVITEFSTGLSANSGLGGITSGPDGNLWFTEGIGNRIGRLNPTTGTITEFSTGLTVASSPQYIIAGSDGNLWFSEANSSKIGRINPTTAVITEFSTGLTVNSNPFSITSGPDGNLWFTEFLGRRIGKINSSGTISEFRLSASGGLTEITSGADGNLWFTELYGNKIGRITPNGIITEFNLLAGSIPYGITSGADGNIWFTEEYGNRIGQINPNTGVITEFSIGLSASSGPLVITNGPDGNIWFTEYFGLKIGRLNPTTGIITEFSTGFSMGSGGGPQGITNGADGNLWFTETGNNRIGRITPSGAISRFDLPTYSGPQGITSGPDGSLWFTETGSNRIGRITTDGLITEFSTGLSANSHPRSITSGPDGNLWFTEYDGSRIGQITPTTGTITEFNLSTGNFPIGITSGSDGNIWFVENSSSHVGKLSLFKTPILNLGFGSPVVAKAGSTTLTFIVTNPNTTNGDSLSGLNFSDSLPAGLVVATPNGVNGNCNGGTVTATAGSSSISLTGGSLPINTTCLISVSVLGTSSGAYTSQVSGSGAISSTQTGPGLASNTASLKVYAPPVASLSLNPTSVSLNSSSTLSLTLTNPNTFVSGGLSGVGVVLPLPAGVVVSSPNSLSGNCGGGTVTANAGSNSVSLTGGSLAASANCLISLSVTSTTSGSKTLQTNPPTSTEGGTGIASSSANLGVNLAATTTSLSLSPSTVTAGQSVTLTATVSPVAATGTVTFSSTTSSLTIPTTPVTLVNGVATLVITPSAAGSYNITATYSGDSNYNVSASTAQSLIVTAVIPATTGSYYHKLTPFRLYDDRPTGTNTPNPSLGVGAGSFKLGETRTLSLSGLTGQGLPAIGIKAITANISIISAGPGAGFVTAYPTTDSTGLAQVLPGTANLAWSNPTAATILSNFGTISVDNSGSFNVYVAGSRADVIIDVTGYYATDSTGVGTGIYRSVDNTQPTLRLYDSRPTGTNAVAPPLGAGDGALASGSNRSLQVTGNLGIPKTASAVVVNLTAFNLIGAAFFKLYPSDASAPGVASLTFIPGSPALVGNLAVVPLSTDGKMTLAAGGAGSGDALIDVVGYIDTTFTVGSNAGLFTSLNTPTRLLDTRPKGTNAIDPPLGAGLGPQLPGTPNVRNFVASGKAGIPSNAIALVAQVTMVDTAGTTYIGLYTGPSWPGTVAVTNAAAGQLPGNLSLIPLDSTGSFNVIMGPGASNYIVDVVGYILGS